MVLHKGSSTSCGHYTSLVNISNQWYHCDDLKVTKVDFDKYCISSEVYLLFYQILS